MQLVPQALDVHACTLRSGCGSPRTLTGSLRTGVVSGPSLMVDEPLNPALHGWSSANVTPGPWQLPFHTTPTFGPRQEIDSISPLHWILLVQRGRGGQSGQSTSMSPRDRSPT